MSYWLLFCVYCALPISSLCIGGFWYFQSLSQSTLALLPYWQHVLLPRAVYVLCGSTLLVCSVTSVGKPRREQPLRSENDSQEENSIVTVYTTEDVRRRVVLSHDLPGESIQQVKPASNEQTSPISIKRNLTLIILLVALWLPIALVLNDGIALSAVLLVIQVSSIIWALSDSQGIYLPTCHTI